MIREFLITNVDPDRTMVNAESEEILISLKVKRRYLYFFWKEIKPEIMLMNPMWNERERTLTMYQRITTEKGADQKGSDQNKINQKGSDQTEVDQKGIKEKKMKENGVDQNEAVCKESDRCKLVFYYEEQHDDIMKNIFSV